MNKSIFVSLINSEQNKQLQQRVKLLQVQQNEKDLKYQESRTELTKKISLEKKKADSMQDAAQRVSMHTSL